MEWGRDGECVRASRGKLFLTYSWSMAKSLSWIDEVQYVLLYWFCRVASCLLACVVKSARGPDPGSLYSAL